MDESFVLHYQVDDLSWYYRGDRVVVNPVRIGTGLKIKNMEALFSGMPLVTTSVGAQGLERWADEAFFVADDAGSFCDCVDRLLSDGALSRKLSEAALKFSRQYRQEHDRTVRNLISRLSSR